MSVFTWSAPAHLASGCSLARVHGPGLVLLGIVAIDLRLHGDFEPDALSLDHHGPRRDPHDAERRDDITFTYQLPVDQRLWRGAHHDRLQLQLTGLIANALDQLLQLLFLH